MMLESYSESYNDSEGHPTSASAHNLQKHCHTKEHGDTVASYIILNKLLISTVDK